MLLSIDITLVVSSNELEKKIFEKAKFPVLPKEMTIASKPSKEREKAKMSWEDACYNIMMRQNQ